MTKTIDIHTHVLADATVKLLQKDTEKAAELLDKALELADVSVHIGNAAATWKQILAARKHWIVADAPGEIDPLARRIARKQVGLALSSGSARGRTSSAAQIP